MKTRTNILSKLIILFLFIASTAFSQPYIGISDSFYWLGMVIGITNPVYPYIPSPIYMTIDTETLPVSGFPGQVNILKTLRMEKTTNLNTGVIYNGSDRFLHNYGIDNTFLGVNSGNFTTPGQRNTAVGKNTLSSNTSGHNNTAVGNSAMFSNTEGDQNVSIGNFSLYTSTSGHENVALGNYALFSNTSGDENAALGDHALFSNTYGDNNTTIGDHSLFSNTTGSFNTAVGENALYNNIDGYYNTAVGPFSLLYNTGSYNVALGTASGNLITSGNNNIAIGYNAQVQVGSNSNQVRMGNTDITLACIQVPWDCGSDRRLKSNILNSNLGLNFISDLRPVSYIRNNDEKQRTEYGFIAQEVEEELKETGIDNSGMINIDDEGMYSMRYNDLISPMVKAIQELKAENDELKKEIGLLKIVNKEVMLEAEQLKTVNEKIAKLEKIVNELSSTKNTSLSGKEVNLTNSK